MIFDPRMAAAGWEVVSDASESWWGGGGMSAKLVSV